MKVPDTKVAEIIDGELIVSPRPAFPHAHAGSVLGADLIGAFHRPPGDPKGPGGWWLLDEPELHFGTDVIVPDQAGWRRKKVPQLPNVAAYDQAPAGSTGAARCGSTLVKESATSGSSTPCCGRSRCIVSTGITG